MITLISEMIWIFVHKQYSTQAVLTPLPSAENKELRLLHPVCFPAFSRASVFGKSNVWNGCMKIYLTGQVKSFRLPSCEIHPRDQTSYSNMKTSRQDGIFA